MNSSRREHNCLARVLEYRAGDMRGALRRFGVRARPRLAVDVTIWTAIVPLTTNEGEETLR